LQNPDKQRSPNNESQVNVGPSLRFTLATATGRTSWAQQGDHYELSGKDVAIYNLLGSVRVETGTGNTVTVDAFGMAVMLAASHSRQR
jgi:hypothetical protein